MKRLIFTLAAVLVLSGCGSSTEPKDRVIVGALAISSADDGFEIAAVCYNPSGQEFETVTVKGQGKTPNGAFSDLKGLEERLYFGHLESVVVEKEAGERILLSISECLASENISDRTSVFVYNGDPMEIFETGTENAITALESLKRIGKEHRRDTLLFYLRRSIASGAEVSLLELQRFYLGDNSNGNRIISVRAGETLYLTPWQVLKTSLIL